MSDKDWDMAKLLYTTWTAHTVSDMRHALLVTETEFRFEMRLENWCATYVVPRRDVLDTETLLDQVRYYRDEYVRQIREQVDAAATK